MIVTFSRKIIVLYKSNESKNRSRKFINKDCPLKVCDFSLLHMIISCDYVINLKKKMVKTFIL